MRVRPACAMKVKSLSFMVRRLASDTDTMLYGPPRKSLESWHCERVLFGGCEIKNERGVWHLSCGRRLKVFASRTGAQCIVDGKIPVYAASSTLSMLNRPKRLAVRMQD